MARDPFDSNRAPVFKLRPSKRFSIRPGSLVIYDDGYLRFADEKEPGFKFFLPASARTEGRYICWRQGERLVPFEEGQDNA